MRIPCPYCGERDARRIHLSAATPRRRGPTADAGDDAAFYDYVYLRDNPAGPHREIWYHAQRLPQLAGGDARHAHARDSSARRMRRRGGSRDEPVAPSRQRRPDRPRRSRCASRFDGKRLPGFAGDTLASALLANGVRLVGRSFKYHRPRGILTAGSRGAERAGRAAHRRAARAEHRGDDRRAFDGLEADQPEPLAVARLRCDGGQPAVRADLRRRLLLQDLHVAGDVLGEALRAADPPRRRPRPRRRRARSRHTTRRRMRFATCW